MSGDRFRVVYISPEIWNSQFAAISKQAERCVERQKKAAPGDRQEMQKYNALCSQLEVLALDLFESGHPSALLNPAEAMLYMEQVTRSTHPWQASIESLPESLIPKLAEVTRYLEQGGVLFHVNDPFGAGTRPLAQDSDGTPIPPAEVWRSSETAKELAAVSERWRQQLERAITTKEPIVPSGVSNRVLTEGLRQYVQKGKRTDSVSARVVYRDGSEARPFPMRILSLSQVLPKNLRVLRVALISMRHPEMDVNVDVAWLRNRDVSQLRPAAETDELAYQLSRKQLQQIADSGPCLILMYQTGFEPAIVGFYRALAEHLATHASPVAVSPRHFSKSRGFQEGTVWVRSN